MRSDKRLTPKNRGAGIKVLLINPFGIGDVLFSTPLIRILKDNFPESALCYICNKRAYEAIALSEDLTEVFVFEKGDYKELWRKSKPRFLKEFILFVKRLKEERFDLAIDMSMGHQYSFFLKLIGVPERVGFDYKARGRFLTKRLKFCGFDDKPIGEYYKDLLRLIGLKVSDHPMTIQWDKEDEKYINDFFYSVGLKEGDLIIGVSPGGGASFGKENRAFKRWPPDKFAGLARMLINEMSARVILTWAPGEEGVVGNIVNSMAVKPIVAPRTTIRQSAYLASRCDCVVCNDAGPLHVAVAAGAPTVSVFGPSDHNVYGPYPKSARHRVVTKKTDCSPCYRRFRIPACRDLRCLEGLDAEDVFSAVAGCVRRSKSDVGAKA